MKKITQVAIVVSLIAPMTSLGQPIPKKLLEIITSKSAKILELNETNAKASITKCEDFSGSYQGDCSSSDGSEESMNIHVSQNGCSSITVDQDKYSFGNNATATISSSSPATTISATWSTRWDLQPDTFHAQALIALDSKNLVSPIGGRINARAQKKKNELHLKGIMQFWLSVDTLFENKFECHLQKI